jgi:hypothetical protein
VPDFEFDGGYSLLAPDSIFFGLNGNVNDTIALAFKVPAVTDYGNLFLFSRSDGTFGSIASFGSFWANSATWSVSHISLEITDEVAYQTALSRQ